MFIFQILKYNYLFLKISLFHILCCSCAVCHNLFQTYLAVLFEKRARVTTLSNSRHFYANINNVILIEVSTKLREISIFNDRASPCCAQYDTMLNGYQSQGTGFVSKDSDSRLSVVIFASTIPISHLLTVLKCPFSIVS